MSPSPLQAPAVWLVMNLAALQAALASPAPELCQLQRQPQAASTAIAAAQAVLAAVACAGAAAQPHSGSVAALPLAHVAVVAAGLSGCPH